MRAAEGWGIAWRLGPTWRKPRRRSRHVARRGFERFFHESKARGAPGPTALTGDPFVGRVLSHYRLEERLGAGGMGVLYRVTDVKLGRAVAVKLLARHLVADERAKARFVREARTASALDHPNIATVYEIGEQDGELFIAMALYEGETLKHRLEKGRLGGEETLDILRQVSLGLDS